MRSIRLHRVEDVFYLRRMHGAGAPRSLRANPARPVSASVPTEVIVARRDGLDGGLTAQARECLHFGAAAGLPFDRVEAITVFDGSTSLRYGPVSSRGGYVRIRSEEIGVEKIFRAAVRHPEDSHHSVVVQPGHTSSRMQPTA
jgi:hypothetical protein